MPKSTSVRSGRVPILISLLIATIAEANEPTLRQLNVVSMELRTPYLLSGLTLAENRLQVFRHGDRTPETFPEWFPNDPHMRDSFHPMGPGALTNVGKRRMYRLGEYLRNRYAEFLGTEYEERRLYGVSSSTSRTKMSLQLVLAALYPPSLSHRKWHERLDWQPIPTHYHRFNRDKLFVSDKCDMFIEELSKVCNSTEIRKQFKRYESFLEYVRVSVGKKSAINLNDILLLHNNLNIEKEMNLTMKPWMTDLLADERLTKMRILYYNVTNYNDLLKRLSAGFLFREIIVNMIRASDATLNFPQKTLLYSGHDKNIISILQALNMYDSHFPEYSSALIFELLSKNKEFYVKILYYLGIPEKIKSLTIRGCATLCPLDQFLSLTKNIQLSDEEFSSNITVSSYFFDNK